MNSPRPESMPATHQAAGRMPLIDALKGIAAQVILLHHLVSYGPLADAANRMWPTISNWLFDYGRMAVQVFLVIAGFLAAKSLAADGRPVVSHPLSLVWRRYARLAPPFMAAMLIALAVALLAERWMQDEAIPEVLDLRQFVAHGLLLHGILDVPSLSVGVWYVAIDLQLYAMLVLVLWLAGSIGGRKPTGVAAMLVAMLGCASLFHFNRLPALDDWGVYFFGSYAMGAFAWWLADRRWPAYWLLVAALVVAVALTVDFRTRIAIALVVAALLAHARRAGWLGLWPQSELLGFLGRISFSVFLLHFPVYLLISALYVRLGAGSDRTAMLAMLLAWGLSIAAGTLFERHVESRKHWLPPGLAAGLRAAVSGGRR